MMEQVFMKSTGQSTRAIELQACLPYLNRNDDDDANFRKQMNCTPETRTTFDYQAEGTTAQTSKTGDWEY